MAPRRPSARRGAAAYKKSPAEHRALTVYAEDGGSWPHLGPVVLELLARGHHISYLTSSATDPVLERGDDLLHTHVIDEGFHRALLFGTLEAKVVIATVPQLGLKIFPRSRHAAANGTKYVYVFHSMVSTHMVYAPDGFDNYDVMLCVGPHMEPELRRREQLHGLPTKQLVPHGYARLDAILGDLKPPPSNDPPVVLVAPSWGPGCLFETCGADLVGVLLDAGLHVIARPHPMTRKTTRRAIPDLAARFAGHPRFELDEHVAAKESLERAEIMVSDWSGAALEFALGMERPVLYVDVPRKVNNPEYAEIDLEPFEARIRERIGAVIGPSQLAGAPEEIARLIDQQSSYPATISAVREQSIYNVGSSASVGADAIEALLG